MNPTAIFWMAAIVMALAAIGFVTMPLYRNNVKAWLLPVAILLPVAALGLYMKLGSPTAKHEVPTLPTSATSIAAVNGTTGEKIGSVASMVDGLAARLENDPDDAKSWLLLARSYQHLNRSEEARTAYEQAAKLGEYDAGLAALSDRSAGADAKSAQVFGNLQLSDKSSDIVLPTDTVFIFARAIDGPPMPVAVLRRTVADLPLDFLLNDSQALNAGSRLSDVERVVVTARISRSGVATEALQGLEAKSNPIVVAENQHINLIIE